MGLSIFGLKELFFMCQCKYSRMKLNPTQCSNVYTVKHFNKKKKINKNTLFFHREINASQLLNIEKVYELLCHNFYLNFDVLFKKKTMNLCESDKHLLAINHIRIMTNV